MTRQSSEIVSKSQLKRREFEDPFMVNGLFSEIELARSSVSSSGWGYKVVVVLAVVVVRLVVFLVVLLVVLLVVRLVVLVVGLGVVDANIGIWLINEVFPKMPHNQNTIDTDSNTDHLHTGQDSTENTLYPVDRLNSWYLRIVQLYSTG